MRNRNQSTEPDGVVRGNIVSWTLNFYDANSNLIVGGPAHITLHYGSASNGSFVEIEMQHTPDGWRAEWDTRHASAGVVYWHAHCRGTAQEGFIHLTANEANR
jgi:hypothetical protein